jgi:HAD superfamily hydrolase (TIGR01549 family)
MYQNRPKAFIFDLDGTLVESELNFSQIRHEIHCPADQDILTFIANLPTEQARNQAEAIVLKHEIADAYYAKWMPGAQGFVEQLAYQKYPLAIVTRNSKAATQVKVNNNNIPIKTILTREDAPAKPEPTALLHIAQKWNMAPADIAYVGDYIYDIQAANNAGMQAWSYGFDTQYYPKNKVSVYFECFTQLHQEFLLA